MTREQINNLGQLTAILCENAPKGPERPNCFRYAREIHKAARSLHHLAECACNGDLTKRQQTREANLEKMATEMLLECGATKVHINGDPRGYAVKAVFPTGEYNTWGGKEDGFGIG